jgi:hypothetical protein
MESISLGPKYRPLLRNGITFGFEILVWAVAPRFLVLSLPTPYLLPAWLVWLAVLPVMFTATNQLLSSRNLMQGRTPEALRKWALDYLFGVVFGLATIIVAYLVSLYFVLLSFDARPLLLVGASFLVIGWGFFVPSLHMWIVRENLRLVRDDSRAFLLGPKYFRRRLVPPIVVMSLGTALIVVGL